MSAPDANILAPPLKGERWLDVDSCCKQIGAHRSALNPINGALHPSEMFAMDLVQLKEEIEFTPVTDPASKTMRTTAPIFFPHPPEP